MAEPRGAYPIGHSLSVTCPTCGMGRGQRCRTKRTNRSTDTHTARFDVAVKVADYFRVTGRKPETEARGG